MSPPMKLRYQLYNSFLFGLSDWSSLFKVMINYSDNMIINEPDSDINDY